MQNCSVNGGLALSEPLRRPSWYSRTFKPLYAGSLRLTLITLTSTALGAGTLATPFAASELGIGVALIVLLCNGFVSMLSTRVLILVSRRLNVHTYGQLVEKSLGLGWLADLIIAFNGMGACTSYFVFLGDFLPNTIRQVVVPGSAMWTQWIQSRTLLLTMALILIWPLCIRQRLSALRHFSWIPVVAVLFTAATVMTKTPGLVRSELARGSQIHLWEFDSVSSLARGFSVFLFAFFQHTNCCPVGSELHDPSDRRVSKLARRVYLSQLAIYVPLTICGYISWMGEVEQNFINNYSSSETLMIAVRLFLTVSMCIAIPMNLIAVGHSTMSLVMTLVSGTRLKQWIIEPQDDLRFEADACTTPNSANWGSTETDLPRLSNVGPERLLSAGTFDKFGDMLHVLEVKDSRPLTSTSTTSGSKRSWEDESSYMSMDDAPLPSSCAPDDTPRFVSSDAMFSIVRSLVATLCLLLCYAIALHTNEVATVIGLIGAIFSTILMCLFPALLWRKESGEVSSRLERRGTSFILFGYSALGGCASIAMIAKASGLCR